MVQSVESITATVRSVVAKVQSGYADVVAQMNEEQKTFWLDMNNMHTSVVEDV